MEPNLSSSEEWWSTIRPSMSMISILAVTVITLITLLLMKQRRINKTKHLPPGPKPLPIIGNIHQMKGMLLHHKLDNLAAEFGPIVFLRLGPKPWVVASSAEAVEEFLKVQDLAWVGRGHTMFMRMLTNNLKNITRAPYGPYWRHIRKICALELFTQKRLESLRPRRSEEIDVTMRWLHEAAEQEKAVEFSEVISQFAVNNMTRMLLNRRLFGRDTEGQMQSRRFKNLVITIFNVMSTKTAADLFPRLRWITYASGYAGYMKKVKRELDLFLENFFELKKVENVASDGENTADFVDVLQAQPSEDGIGHLDNDCVRAVTQDMLVAGSDTTATAIEWTIAELIRHPQCMEKLQGELDTVAGTDRVVSETDLSNLPYLQAVVKESFRLHPPGALGVPRMALQPTKVWGYDLPANTQLFVNFYSIHRDPKLWANPLEFRPERFIKNPQIDLKGSHFQFLPFGAGRRMCPGMSLGILVTQIGVARLAQGFNFALLHGEDPRNLNMTERFATVMSRANPLVVIPKPRLPSNLY